jgi:hypothetical protein
MILRDRWCGLEEWAGAGLEETMTYEPFDEVQERIFSRFAGGSFPVPPRRFIAVGRNLFAPAGMPLQAFSGYARQLLVSYHGIRDGHAIYRCAGGRMTRRATPTETEVPRK